MIRESELAFADMIQGFYVEYVTDHLNSLRVDTLPVEKLDPKLFRWWAFITSRGERACKHIPGSAHLVPDGISRNPKDRDALLELREGWKADPHSFSHLFDLEAYHDLSDIVNLLTEEERYGCANCVLKDLEAGHIGFFLELWCGLMRWTRCCGDQGLPVIGPFDWSIGGQMMDLAGPGQTAVLILSRAGLIHFVLLAATCTTMSWLRNIFGNSKRTLDNVVGEKLDESIGNAECEFANLVCQTQHKQGKGFGEENPHENFTRYGSAMASPMTVIF